MLLPSVVFCRQTIHNPLCLLVFVAGLALPASAWAEEQSPTTDESADLGSAVIDADPNDDASYLDPALAGDDVILVYGARPDRPYHRDTKRRLTGEELRKRGINNVSEALEMLPEINVRAIGRGGRQIDIRGARKGSVKILLDGIAISDPFYGNLDLSAIPITDIEEIRVSSSPASPIDGAGGPGGVIEILTRDAVGPASVRARVTGSSEPSVEASATGRTMLSKHLAARVSATVVTGRQDFEVLAGNPMNSSTFIPEERVQSVGAARIEYRKGSRRFVTDLWTQQSAFAVPPKTTGTSNIYQVVDGETQGRLGMVYDDKLGAYKWQVSGHLHLLTRETSKYSDAALTTLANIESLNGLRTGLGLLGNREVGKRWQLIASANLESDRGDAEGLSGQFSKGRTTITQGAVAAQYEQDNFDAQTSAGVAIPLGLGASPWPEFKSALRYEPTSLLELSLITGHKGRVPTLRERHDFGFGNAKLGPEKALFGEFGVKVEPTSFLQAGAKAYVRSTNGIIVNRTNAAGEQMFTNTDRITIHGVDARIEGKLRRWFSGGASWNYAVAEDTTGDSRPLDFLPRHRMSSWIRAASDSGGATLRVQYWGTQVDQRTELPRRALVQLSGYYRFLERYQFTIRAENVAGHNYQLRAAVPGPGRQVYASVQSEWE